MKMYQHTIFDKEQPPKSGWMNVYPNYALGLMYDSRGEADNTCVFKGEAIYRIRIKLKEEP